MPEFYVTVDKEDIFNELSDEDILQELSAREIDNSAFKELSLNDYVIIKEILNEKEEKLRQHGGLGEAFKIEYLGKNVSSIIDYLRQK